MREPRALYAAFDRFPSRKGSAVHIDRFARALFEWTGGGLLYVLGGDGLPAGQREGDVEIVRFSLGLENYLERALAFSARLERLASPAPRLVHFRDPWSGMPLLGTPAAKVYEVNGFPSVELPYAHPDLPPATLARVRGLEDRCLAAADAVVVPAPVIAAAVAARGVAADRIHVVPNGADLPIPAARPPGAPGRYLLYFGALQPWQGLDTALRALRRLNDLGDLRLVVCSSVHPRKAKGARKLAERIGVADRVQWRFSLPAEELAPWVQHAVASLAPLRDTARNVEQGCAPLKVLESMAAGTPVIASDLPAVRELMADGREGLLVAPDRPGELARAVRRLLDDPVRAHSLGAAGRARIVRELTWEHSVRRLRGVYGRLVSGERDWIAA